MMRYQRNHEAISQAEQELLGKAKVLVAGCGGLGGYIIELLGRLGVGHITAVDSDVFEFSNLNRQLLASSSTLGRPKAVAAQERMREVNPWVHVEPRRAHIDAVSAPGLVLGHELVLDALDNMAARRALLKAAQSAGLPFVHGAIVGWRGRVSVAMPGDLSLSALFELADDGVKPPDGNLGFAAALVASVQVSEAVKLIIGRGASSRNKLLEFDLLGAAFDQIPLN